MALARRGQQRFSATIWPGFVDAMTALLLVLMFVLTIFMVVQSVLRETISSKENELSALSEQVAGLARALALEESRAADLENSLAGARQEASAQAALIATLSARLDERTAELDAAGQRITAFEAQVAALLTQRDTALAERNSARADATARADELRLDRATIEELRAKLQASGDELAAMTLALEESRRRAEETLTLLAAAEAAKRDLQLDIDKQMGAAEKQAALLAVAEAALADQKELSASAARRVTLLNEQVAALRGQLAELQGILDAAKARDTEAQVQVETLGAQLNAALAQVAAEQKRRAELEAEARRKAEEEARDLARYRSEFFGRLSQILAGREGVRVVGDRFVFSSEVLFEPGSADLSPEGWAQIAQVATMLNTLSGQIPSEIDWIIRVDGHTDDTPLSGQGAFADNWELSQARALSVVRAMIADFDFPPERLAATGFGEHRPVLAGTSAEARAANRRIELKLTER